MALQEIYFIAEIIAAIAVVGSLIFVGIQLQQGTAATRAATSQAALVSYTDISMALVDNPDLVTALWQKQRFQSSEWVEAGDVTIRLNYYMNAGLKIIEGNYLQWLDGNLSDEMWHGFRHALIEMFASNAAWAEHWSSTEQSFSAPFQTLIEEIRLQAEERYNERISALQSESA